MARSGMVWWWVAVLCAALLQAHAAAPHGVDVRGLSHRLLQHTTVPFQGALGRVLRRRGGRMRLKGGGSGKKGAPEAAALITEHKVCVCVLCVCVCCVCVCKYTHQKHRKTKWFISRTSTTWVQCWAKADLPK
jgi:hypothetical protein